MGSGAKRCGSGATDRRAWIFVRRRSSASSIARACCRWRWHRCWCAAANASRCWATAHARQRARRTAPHRRMPVDGRGRRCRAAARCADDAQRAIRVVQRFSFAARRHRNSAAPHRAARGARHLVHIVDPAEEDFPFKGRTRFEAANGDYAKRSAGRRPCAR